MNGRVYDPAVGMFISADPIEGGNRYAYVDNNPMRFTDPSGFCSGICHLWHALVSDPTNQTKDAVNNLANGLGLGLGHLGDEVGSGSVTVHVEAGNFCPD